MKHYNLSFEGRTIAILGRSSIAGLPITLACLARGGTVINISKDDANPIEKVRMADIVISAMGEAHKITEDWIKPNAIISIKFLFVINNF